MSENPKAANFGDLALDLETNYDIDCQLLSFDVTKHNEKGNRYQDCVLSDGQEDKKVKIWEGRNGMPLEEKNRNEWLTFNLSARAGTGKWKDNKYIGGFWDSSAPMINAPQSSPQRSQASAQRPNVPEPAPQSYNNRDASICRQTAGKVVAEILTNIVNESDMANISAEVVRIAKPIADWFLTGKVPANVPAPQVTECPHCKKPHPECSCTVPF